ncbi:MAG: SDR family oxidoreductase [Bdellovibrionales bacterium]|nr:SDR family oxidoreductase [Bdellovibrionales bacterium]
MKNTESKCILITGASSGFGKLITEKLIENNHIVFAALRGGESRGKEIFSHLPNHPKLHFVDLDLLDENSIKASVTQVEKIVGKKLDVLINNAGVGVVGPLELQTIQQLRNQFEVNFFGPVQMIQVFLPFLRVAKGRIINITSMAAFTTFPFFGTYSATKHALDILTESLYYDLIEFEIKVCSVQPGAFKTNFNNSVQIADTGQNSHYYQKKTLAFAKFIQLVKNKFEKDPQVVVHKVASLCEAQYVPIQVRLGQDAKMNWFFRKLLPTNFLVRLQNWFYNKWIFKSDL